MLTTFHPRPDNHGKPVVIKRPSKPSPIESWFDSSAVATVIPDGPLPAALSGIAFNSWTDYPEIAQNWESVEGINPKLEEPAFPQSDKSPAAGVVVIESDGRVWLVHPSNQFGGYEATMPKGRQDPGLSLQATAIREAWEESGLQVRITGCLGDFERSQTMTRLYLAERLGGSPADMTWESQAVSLAPVCLLDGLLTNANDKAVLVRLREVLGE